MFKQAYITKTAAFLPNAPVSNDQIDQALGYMGRKSEAVKRRVLMNNGIQSRNYAIDTNTGEMTHTNIQLTAEAIRKLQAGTRFKAEQIRCLACGTSSPDQLIPSHGSMVHAEIDSPPCEVITTSGVCCAGMTALKYAFLSVASGSSANAVATGSELASPSLRASHFQSQLMALEENALVKKPILAFSDQFLRWALSDGAGAMWIESAPSDDAISLRIDWLDLISYANRSDVCMYCGMRKHEDGSNYGYRIVDDRDTFEREGYLNLAQDVQVLQDRLPPLTGEMIQQTINKRELTADAIDWFLPHYSSKWFRQPLYDCLRELGMEIPYERWFTNLAEKGNTGSASIYIILDELLSSGKIKRGHRLLCFVPESARMTFSLMHLTAV